MGGFCVMNRGDFMPADKTHIKGKVVSGHGWS